MGAALRIDHAFEQVVMGYAIVVVFQVHAVPATILHLAHVVAVIAPGHPDQPVPPVHDRGDQIVRRRVPLADGPPHVVLAAGRAHVELVLGAIAVREAEPGVGGAYSALGIGRTEQTAVNGGAEIIAGGQLLIRVLAGEHPGGCLLERLVGAPLVDHGPEDAGVVVVQVDPLRVGVRPLWVPAGEPPEGGSRRGREPVRIHEGDRVVDQLERWPHAPVVPRGDRYRPALRAGLGVGSAGRLHLVRPG